MRSGRRLARRSSGQAEELDHFLQLHRLPEDQRLPLMCAAGADLAAFHARGQWHGGAQTRNLTWNGQHFARLDFEERLHPGLPLATVQVYDALQLLLSLARYLQPLGPSAVHAVLRAYAEADTGGRQPDLRAFVARELPRLRWVSRLAGWSARLDGSREWTLIRTEDTENKDEIDHYLERRGAQDPELWIIELDIANGERFIGLTPDEA